MPVACQIRRTGWYLAHEWPASQSVVHARTKLWPDRKVPDYDIAQVDSLPTAWCLTCLLHLGGPAGSQPGNVE